MSWQSLLPDVLGGNEDVRATHSLDLEPLPRSAAAARRFVRENIPELPAETEDALVLLTSELVTNAVLHARTPIVLGIAITEESIVVGVHDLDLARPEQEPYGQREGGWGLGLVATLAQSSAVARDPEGGKTAWFRILRGPVPHVSDDAAARSDAARRDS